MYIFNLPDNINKQDIKVMMNSKDIKGITIKYCLLGLPAYARVEFKDR